MSDLPEKLRSNWPILLGLLALAAAMILRLPHLAGLPLFLALAWWLAWPWRRETSVSRLLWIVTGLGLLQLAVQSWSVLSPFVVAFVISYLLEPLISLLSRHMKRSLATGLVLLVFLVVVLTLVSLTLPVLVRESSDLLKEVPRMAREAETWSRARLPQVLEATGISLEEVNSFLQQKGPQLLRRLLDMVGSGSQALVSWMVGLGGSLVNLFLIPFLVYSFSLGSPRILRQVRHSLKPEWEEPVKHYASQVDRVLSGYVRGQLMVSSIIALLTWLGLWLTGVPYPLLLGLATGLLNVIPYIGISFIFLVSLTVAMVTMDPMGGALRVVSVFVVVQNLEGFVISPRILGNAVGLSPVLALFCLLFFGSLFGVAGMIVAIPLGGILLLIARDLHHHWLSRLDREPLEDPE